MMRYLTLALMTAATLACGGNNATVQCDVSPNCDLSGGGVCRAAPSGNRWCAYPDASCPSGYRWSSFQTGDGLSGVCVSSQPDGGIDAPPDASNDAVTVCRLRVVFVDGKPPFSSQDDGTGRREVWVSNPDGSGLINLSNSPSTDNAHPTWSPDGLSVAFSSNRSGRYDIFVVNAGGVGLANLTSGAAFPHGGSRPVWSPDGTRIAFTAGTQVWVMNANGTGASPVATVNAPAVLTSDEIAWSPDSRQIVYGSSDGSTFALYVATIGDSSAPLKINSGNAHESQPGWAPSPRIAFTNLSDVFTVNGNGTGLFNVTKAAASQNESPVQLSGGNMIAFSSTRGGHGEIWSIPSNGGTALQVTHNTIAFGGDVPNAASSDGNLIAFSRIIETVQPNNSIVTTYQLGVTTLDGSAVHLFNGTGENNATEASLSACP